MALDGSKGIIKRLSCLNSYCGDHERVSIPISMLLAMLCMCVCVLWREVRCCSSPAAQGYSWIIQRPPAASEGVCVHVCAANVLTVMLSHRERHLSHQLRMRLLFWRVEASDLSLIIIYVGVFFTSNSNCVFV